MCSSSSSLPTILTAARESFSFAIAALKSPLASPKSFCTATRISGDSGFLMTRVKLFPSGHAFWVPLHNFTRSASGMSESLLPAETTTAMFLIAATLELPSIEAMHKRVVIRSRLPLAFTCIMPALTFRRISKSMFSLPINGKHPFRSLCPTVRLPSGCAPRVSPS